INAHNKINEKEPLVLKRSEAYIGVLIDDLVNKGTQEPYRMFTSRAEYRILLRQDNADLRLTEIGHKLGLASDSRLENLLDKKNAIAQLKRELKELRATPETVNAELAELNTAQLTEKIPVENLLKRPNLGMPEIKRLDPLLSKKLSKYSHEVLQQVEINTKYESYIEREQKLAEKILSLDNYKIRPDFDYDRVKALSAEAREKLKKIKPETIGQLSRISGVSPADVSVLTVYMGK
ncbi:MAG: tRNA uridine-5-carboxymethylaminomethyl(34) synthesis enzyme MnmG, partial [Cytophagales bacterium]